MNWKAALKTCATIKHCTMEMGTKPRKALKQSGSICIKSEPGLPQIDCSIKLETELCHCSTSVTRKVASVDSASLLEIIKKEPEEVKIIKEESVEPESFYSSSSTANLKKVVVNGADLGLVADELETSTLHRVESVLGSHCHQREVKEEPSLFWPKEEEENLTVHDERTCLDDVLLPVCGLGETVSSPFYPCPYCVVSFTNASYLEAHLKWTHQQQYHTLLQSRASKHNSHQEPLQKHSCVRCSKSFRSRQKLANHVRQMHSGDLPGKRFSCPRCSRSFNYLARLQNHCQQSHQLATVCKDGHLSCGDCGETFGDSRLTGPHMCGDLGEAVDPGAACDAENMCNVCCKTYSSPQSLRIHMRSHTGEKPYTCTECGKQFAESSTLRNHLRIHSGVKPYHCPECGKQFGRMNQLKSHLLTHTGEKPYACQDCGKRFGHKADLRIHQRTHSGEKPFRCGDCGKGFAIVSNLRVHERVHTMERTHQCGECGRRFSEATVLRKHLRTHTGERPYHCTTCGKRFGRLQHLKNHRRTHTGEKPYGCEECGKCFAQSGDLTKHKRTHTGEKPYACAHCERTYSSSGDLRKHSRSHSDQRPYSCQQCDKSFRMLHHLKMHVRTHTGERPYQCPQCPLTFTRPHHLSSHLAVHKTQDMPEDVTL